MYNLTFNQNDHFSLKNNQKNHVYFMPHAFSQSEHPFAECKHFNQIEHSEKIHDYYSEMYNTRSLINLCCASLAFLYECVDPKKKMITKLVAPTFFFSHATDCDLF